VEFSNKPAWIAGNRGNTTRTSLKWILEHDAIPCVIPGFNSVAQIEDFTVKEMAKLAHFYKYEVHREIKGAY
jgi:hypothetical protein